MYTILQANNLIRNAKLILESSRNTLSEAREITKRPGLSVDSCILDASYQNPFLPNHFQNNINQNNDTTNNQDPVQQNESSSFNLHKHNSNNNSNNDQHKNSNHDDDTNKSLLKAYPPVLSTTGGHSNIDHIIQYTGNYRDDTIAEYKRKLKRRIRAMQPEQKGTDRWDQPRVAGSRRRRILREMDLPSAPPEPPPSGYVIFIAQMTTKIRHDRPHVHHNQIKVVREISKVWKYGMSNPDREYYNTFCRQLREEYELQHAEYRATGSYKPSKVFERLHGDGPWCRIEHHEKNSLEREISNYPTVKFPPRPLEMEKPAWLKKVESARVREMERRRTRNKKHREKKEEERNSLVEISLAKERRLKNRL